MTEYLCVSRDEIQDLNKFLYSVGYISYENHMPIHDLIKRIGDFLNE